MARKKAAAHHGGAWKVAYADFVTAMMALFLVLWISAQDKKILISTSRYFQNPFTSPMDNKSGLMPEEGKQSSKSTKEDGSKQNSSTREIDLAFLNAVAKDLYRLLHLDEDTQDRPIEIEVTSDGLRVTLFDRAKHPLFDDNTAEFTEWGRFTMQNLAWMVDRHKFFVVIEGHTRTGIKFTKKDYGEWELSADRANAARRALTYYAVDPAHVERVTGYADTHPLSGIKPTDEGNQRVTLSLTPHHQSSAIEDKTTILAANHNSER